MKINKILNKDIWFNFEIGVYRQDILFIYGDLKTQSDKIRPNVQEHLKTKYDSAIQEMLDDNYLGMYNSRHPFRIIHVEKQPSLSEFMAILAHEALHCTFELLDYRGMKLGSKSEEAYTHLHDYLIEIIVKEIFENETNS